MSRKRVLLGVLLVALYAVFLVAWFSPALWFSRPDEAGESSYASLRLGMAEAEALAQVKMAASPHGSSDLERERLIPLAEEGHTNWPNAEVTSTRREDGSVLYRKETDGQPLGHVRWWDTPEHNLVVVFGPDGQVIGKVLYQAVPRKKVHWWKAILGG